MFVYDKLLIWQRAGEPSGSLLSPMGVSGRRPVFGLFPAAILAAIYRRPLLASNDSVTRSQRAIFYELDEHGVVRRDAAEPDASLVSERNGSGTSTGCGPHPIPRENLPGAMFVKRTIFFLGVGTPS